MLYIHCMLLLCLLLLVMRCLLRMKYVMCLRRALMYDNLMCLAAASPTSLKCATVSGMIEYVGLILRAGRHIHRCSIYSSLNQLLNICCSICAHTARRGHLNLAG